MKKYFKLIIVLFCIFCFASCKKDIVELEEIEYLPYPPSVIETFDSYLHTVIENGVEYKSTYFFEDGESIALKMEVAFLNNKDAQEFYNEKFTEPMITHLNINDNVVTYYERYEYFDSYLSTKEEIMNLVDSVESDLTEVKENESKN